MNVTLDRSKAPAVRPLPRLSLPVPDRLQTAGGLELNVLTSAVCDAPVFQLRVIVGGVGSLDHFSPEAAMLYPLMLNQGSEGMDGDAVSELFEGAGAWLNIGLQNHHLDITLRGLTDTAGEVVGGLARMLAHPIFPPDRLAVVGQSRAMQREVALTQPKVLAREATSRMLWGENHRAAAVPSPEGLRSTTRTDLMSAHNLFDPGRMSLYLSGHVTPDLTALVADSFDDIFGARTGARAVWTPDIQLPVTNADMVRIGLPDSRQAAISMNIPTIMRSHPDYELLRLAITGLGGYFGSRLNSTLREERGLTYGVNASLVGSLDGAYMSVTTECRKDAADEAVAVIEDEIARFISDPPSGEELRRLLGFSSSRLAAILDSPFTILDTALVQQATIGTPNDYFDRTQKAIAETTPDELSRVVATHLSGPRCIAIVG